MPAAPGSAQRTWAFTLPMRGTAICSALTDVEFLARFDAAALFGEIAELDRELPPVGPVHDGVDLDRDSDPSRPAYCVLTQHTLPPTRHDDCACRV